MEKNKKITLIEGNMFAGKTKHIFDLLKKKNIKEEEIISVKIGFHTRDGDFIKSRAYPDDKLHCDFINDVSDFVELINNKENKNKNTIIIDEAQFMPIDIIPIIRTTNKDVICAGLNSDFLKNKWKTTEAIREVADEVITLKADCQVCKEPSEWSCKVVDNNKCSSNIALESESVIYEPRCEKHYIK